MADIIQRDTVVEGRSNSGPWIVLVVVLLLLIAFGIWWFLLRDMGSNNNPGGGNSTAPVVGPRGWPGIDQMPGTRTPSGIWPLVAPDDVRHLPISSATH